MSRRFYLTGAPAQVAAHFAPLGAGELDGAGPLPGEVGALHTAPLMVWDEGAIWSTARWGLVPAGTPAEAVQASAERRLLARAESLRARPALRDGLMARRCVVPASGFFVWAQVGDERVRLRVQRRDGGLMAFAGVWDEWHDTDGQWLRTFALCSVAANRLVAPLSARMPAMLSADAAARWLDPATPERARLALLRPCAVRDLELRGAGGEVLSAALRAELLHSAPSERRARRSFPTRRVLKREEAGADGKVFFSTRSWTAGGEGRWHPVVDTHDAGVWCDCPDFRFRYARFEPTLHTPHLWCKHVARAVRNCARHGELKLERAAVPVLATRRAEG